MNELREEPAEVAEAALRASAHFDDVERAIANTRLGELLRDVPPVEEQIRQVKASKRAAS